jgi:hypothetical protein
MIRFRRRSRETVQAVDAAAWAAEGLPEIEPSHKELTMKLRSTLALAALALTLLAAPPAVADVPVKATACNKTTKPVEFHFFNRNDLTQGLAALSIKTVRECSCVPLETHTDLWHNFPVARINQLVYRDVSSVTSASIKVCVDAKGKFEGYIDGKVSTCAEARKETSYLPAPELTRAQGDLVVLQSHLYADSSECEDKDWTGGCVRYRVTYEYTDGAACYGN